MKPFWRARILQFNVDINARLAIWIRRGPLFR
jgi:hypothetical protein